MNGHPEDLNALDDEELARQACHQHPQHNPLAVRVLMERHFRYLCGCAFRAVGDAEVARSAVVEAFIRLKACRACNPDRAQGQVNVRSCLCSEARNRAIDAVRRPVPRVTGRDDHPDLPAAEVPEVLDAEVARRVNECRDGLPSLERQVLIEMDVDGRRARQFAEEHEDELMTDEERQARDAGTLDEHVLRRRLEQRVFRLRYRALDLMRECLERKCRDGLTAAERRVYELVEDSKMPVARAADVMSEELAEPGDAALDADAAAAARLARAEGLIESARRKVNNCMESYLPASSRP